jgi:hypothetical protein
VYFSFWATELRGKENQKYFLNDYLRGVKTETNEKPAFHRTQDRENMLIPPVLPPPPPGGTKAHVLYPASVNCYLSQYYSNFCNNNFNIITVFSVGKEKPLPAVIFSFMCTLLQPDDGQSNRPQRDAICTDFTAFLSVCRDEDKNRLNSWNAC